jgi:hypothetical protein
MSPVCQLLCIVRNSLTTCYRYQMLWLNYFLICRKIEYQILRVATLFLLPICKLLLCVEVREALTWNSNLTDEGINQW